MNITKKRKHEYEVINEVDMLLFQAITALIRILGWKTFTILHSGRDNFGKGLFTPSKRRNNSEKFKNNKKTKG